MKLTSLTLALVLLVSLSSSVYSQTDQEPKTEKVKTGWNFGGLPVVAFDSDLGFQYGALLNIFNYGDGSRYPDFNHNLYVEWSRFTKGSGINRIFFDSKTLIPGIRFTTDLSYLTDGLYDFFGFNGYESVFNPLWVNDEDDDYLSRAFYKYDRKMFRFTVDLQGKLPMKNFGWAAGVGLYNYDVGSVDVAGLNEGKDDNLLPDIPGLYDHYVSWGLISADEADGGFATILKGGLVYDTRDFEPNPMKGVWTEAVFTYAPSFLGIGKDFQHVKFSLTHRQYFTLVPERLSFAYRLGYQGTILGKTPFYLQQNLTTLILRGSTSEGLGGGKSLRGVIRNRVVGDGVAYGNAELRWKFVRFQFINQNFYLSLNTFVDGGQVISPIKINTDNVDWLTYDWQTPDKVLTKDDIFSTEKESLHLSWGVGLRIVMNQNFIIAVDHGRPFDSDRDGLSGTYIGLNFLF